MATMLSVQKSERSKLRKLPFLPRFGFTIEVAGRQLTYRQVPLLETLLNARERGLTLKNLLSVAAEALDEVRFPAGAGRSPLAAVRDLAPRVGRKASVKASRRRSGSRPTDAAAPEA